MLKAILFDMDDTLIDWSGFKLSWREREAIHMRGVYDYVNEQVHPLDVDFDVFVDTYMQHTRDGWAVARSTLRAPHMGAIILGTLQAMGVPESRLDERRCLEAYNWGIIPGVEVFPDTPEALQTFIDAGVKIGIVTNASQPMWLRDTELEEYDLMRYFPTCRFSAADAGYLKPHPNIFLTAMKCMETKPEETVFVGDNPVADIAGAQGAGMKAVMRINHEPPRLISGVIVPDAAVNSLMELPAILDDWYPDWR